MLVGTQLFAISTAKRSCVFIVVERSNIVTRKGVLRAREIKNEIEHLKINNYETFPFNTFICIHVHLLTHYILARANW